MKSNFHIVSDGNLERHENTVYFVNAKGKRPIPIENIQQISCHGSISLTSQALHLFSKKGILVHFFNYYGFYDGSYYPRETLLSGELLVKQVSHFLDERKRLEIAKKFVKGSIGNMRKTIAEYKIEGKNEVLSSLSQEVDNCCNTVNLMNVEARSRIEYYNCFQNIIKGDLKFEKRTKQPPQNEINTMISFGNSLLYSTVLSELYNTQLNPTISYLHEPGERRFSLSLDLAELFKPLIVDRLIFYLVNKRIVKKKDFKGDLKGVLFTEKGKRTFLKYYEEKLQTTIKHRGLRRRISYQRLIRLEAYKLIKHLLGVKLYKPFVIWW
ncbi:MAG: type I-B CRISPR-associated endonuclease Cas1 [Candidatus Heimdallarchaeota archaeon]|nr:type I-B CRISPR-associated endonuclease Cas1 [Candidatus Heimdallarchaeota archaeon]